jgi:hypothetical protein
MVQLAGLRAASNDCEDSEALTNAGPTVDHLRDHRAERVVRGRRLQFARAVSVYLIEDARDRYKSKGPAERAATRHDPSSGIRRVCVHSGP